MSNLEKLIDIRAIASRTLEEYADTGSAAEEKYLAETVHDIARIALGDVTGAPCVPKKNWLEAVDMTFARFHAGNMTAFIGTRRNKGDAGGTLIEARVRKDGDNLQEVEIDHNGERFFEGVMRCGEKRAEHILMGAVRTLVYEKFKYRGHHCNGKMEVEA